MILLIFLLLLLSLSIFTFFWSAFLQKKADLTKESEDLLDKVEAISVVMIILSYAALRFALEP